MADTTLITTSSNGNSMQAINVSTTDFMQNNQASPVARRCFFWLVRRLRVVLEPFRFGVSVERAII